MNDPGEDTTSGSAPFDSGYRVAVIMAVHNGADTIDTPIASVIAQTHTDWELIIVDNASTDDTRAKIDGWARREPRIKVLSEPTKGVSFARNLGLREATCRWVSFLDADDSLTPTALQSLTGALRRDPKLVGVHGHWDRRHPDGDVVKNDPWAIEGDLFPALARTCVFAIHSCVVRRSLLMEVGGFPTDLTTCEDWDLWQRAGRTGGRFGYVPECVAYYHMRRGSASNAGFRLARDAMLVNRRAHGPDARVPRPARRWREGEHPSLLPSALLYSLGWCAGLVIGAGEDAEGLVELLSGTRVSEDNPHDLARCMEISLLLPGCHRPAEWPTLWPRFAPRVRAFLDAIEAQSDSPQLGTRTFEALREVVLERIHVPGQPVHLGARAFLSCEATAPIEDVMVPDDVSRLTCDLTLEGDSMGRIELPVFDGLVPASVLRDAVAARTYWQLLERFFGYHQLSEWLARPADQAQASGGGEDPSRLQALSGRVLETVRTALHNRRGVANVLRDIWGLPDAPAEALLGGTARFPADVDEQVIDASSVVVEVSGPVRTLRVNAASVTVTATLAGATLCRLAVSAPDGRVRPEAIYRGVLAHGPYAQCIVAARELLCGQSLTATPGTLRARAQDRWRRTVPGAGAFGDPGWAQPLEAAPAAGPPETYLTVGRRASQRGERRGTLPNSLRAALEAGAETTGERVVGGPDARSQGPIVHAPERWDQILLPETHPGVHDARPIQVRGDAGVPVLMYHRVAATGAAATARWRVTPAQFEAQLALLQKLGFYSVTLDEWGEAALRRSGLPGRPVVLTFDDGYLDFYEHAWPLLRRYGFGATMFLVAGRVGDANRWDAEYGEEVKLMSWEHIRELQDAGIRFGSHAMDHPFLTQLTPAQQAQQLALSRMRIIQEIGSCDTLAYPYGDSHEVTHRIAAAAGYSYAVTCEHGHADPGADPHAIPRIEVRGDQDLRVFRKHLFPPAIRRAPPPVRQLWNLQVHAVRRLEATAGVQWMERKLPRPIYDVARRWYRDRYW